MKKFIVLVAVAVLAMAVSPAMAGVWWAQGDPGTTYQEWHFTPGNVSASGAGYTSAPEVAENPNLDAADLVALVSPVYQGSIGYDGQTGFTGAPALQVFLQIPNYENPNLYKEIWVDLGEGVAVDSIVPTGHDGPSTSFDTEVLPGEGIWEFGVRIWPNPQYEKILFTVLPAAGTGEVYLDYISVSTICVPEPMSLVLLGVGSLLLRKRR